MHFVSVTVDLHLDGVERLHLELIKLLSIRRATQTMVAVMMVMYSNAYVLPMLPCTL